MPMYEYKCKQCARIVSELRKISEREKPLKCPRCGGEADVVMSSFSSFNTSSPECPAAPGGKCDTGFS